MEILENIINVLIILGVSIAGITFIVFMIKMAIEPEQKSKYLKLTKHLMIATVLITISLSILEIPKQYYGDSIEIVDNQEAEATVEELHDEDCQGRETVKVDGSWYVVTNSGWTLYKSYGQDNMPMSRAYALNIYATVGVENVDVLRPFSDCQGTTKGAIADISYYRDSEGFIFPANYSYSAYIDAKTNGESFGRRR